MNKSSFSTREWRVYSSIFIFYLNSPGPLTQRIHSLILPALEVTQSPVGQQDIDNITLLIHRSQPTEPAPEARLSMTNLTLEHAKFPFPETSIGGTDVLTDISEFEVGFWMNNGGRFTLCATTISRRS